ncbi:hypothetical protein [Thermincola potens]|uniref:hypothetical protein n=1 Tax=Thermincola potens TaxID=863643 RepID=UPI0005A08F92|nr:hypothetical protein [Thermincola potens]
MALSTETDGTKCFNLMLDKYGFNEFIGAAADGYLSTFKEDFGNSKEYSLYRGKCCRKYPTICMRNLCSSICDSTLKLYFGIKAEGHRKKVLYGSHQ